MPIPRLPKAPKRPVKLGDLAPGGQNKGAVSKEGMGMALSRKLSDLLGASPLNMLTQQGFGVLNAPGGKLSVTFKGSEVAKIENTPEAIMQFLQSQGR